MSGYIYQHWPNTLYRWNEYGEREGATFKSPEDVEPGYVEMDTLGPPPANPKQRPAPEPAPKTPDQLREENARLFETVKLYEAETPLKDARIAKLEDFLTLLAADEGAPEKLKSAIGEVLSGEPPPKPKPKKAKAPAA